MRRARAVLGRARVEDLPGQVVVSCSHHRNRLSTVRKTIETHRRDYGKC
eukprot:COSAG06_NODE_60082_length_272_cov_0.595376_1_plen_48_part_01